MFFQMEFVTKEDDPEECSSTTLVYQVSPDAEDQQSLLTDQESTIDWTLQEIWSSQKPDQTDENFFKSGSSFEFSFQS